MRWLDRLLLFLFSFVMTILSALMLTIGFNLVQLNTVNEFFTMVYRQTDIGIAWIVGSILLLLISIRFLLWGNFKEKAPASVHQRNNHGDVKISLETISNLALKAAHRIRGLKDVKTKVTVKDEGLILSLKLNVEGDRPIPDLSEELQTTVKAYVEDIAGVPVSDITVYVANVVSHTSVRNRVE